MRTGYPGAIRTARSPLVSIALLIALATACAGSYYDQYRQANPDWLPVFPDPGASLEETLASLYAPNPTRANVVLRKLQIFRTDVDPWQEIAFDSIRKGTYKPSDAADYAVIANFYSIARIELTRLHGEKVGWYLLPDNQLASYDHYVFMDAYVSNDFRASTANEIDTEKRLVALIAQNYPASMVHVTETYRKGMEYVRTGRLGDAEVAIAAASRAVDVRRGDCRLPRRSQGWCRRGGCSSRSGVPRGRSPGTRTTGKGGATLRERPLAARHTPRREGRYSNRRAPVGGCTPHHRSVAGRETQSC